MSDTQILIAILFAGAFAILLLIVFAKRSGSVSFAIRKILKFSAKIDPSTKSEPGEQSSSSMTRGSSVSIEGNVKDSIVTAGDNNVIRKKSTDR